MKLHSQIFAALLLIASVAAAQTSQQPAMGSTVAPNPAFDRIKTLAGNWEGMVQGKKVTANYKVMSAGSAVMMVQEGEAPGEEMITIFHPDNEKLMVTHYCSAKNQPRMRMVPGPDPNVIKFEFLDATNLPSPNAPHMVGLTLKMVDKDHHVQTWTFAMDGKTMTENFEMKRTM